MPEFKDIAIAISRGKNIFLNGPGGTGKTYTIRKIYDYFIGKMEIAILAPTGMAALELNLNGQTINRFFNIPPVDTKNITQIEINRLIDKIKNKKNKTLENVDLIIIDEISMVGKFLLTMIDGILRHKFNQEKVMGGVTMVFSGDFYQLPPVKDEWVFKTEIWEDLNLTIFKFEESKRYLNNETFEFMLRLRVGKLTDDDILLLKSRREAFNNKEYKQKYKIKPIRLYSTNKIVNKYNNKKLNKIKSKLYVFTAKDTEVFHVNDVGIERGNINIDDKYNNKLNYLYNNIKKVKEELCPTKVFMKVGAKMMFCRNYDANRELVNGLIVTIKDINIGKKEITVMENNGNIHKIYCKLFTIKHRDYTITRTQIPLKLAWAITIHKSQGITLDNAIINISEIYNPGQVYVALSRVRNINDIYIYGTIDINLIYANYSVLNKFN